MKQKLMALLMVLLLICPAAMATETIPLPDETKQTTVVEDEDLVSLTEEELLEKMAGDGTDSMTVLPEDSNLNIRSTYNLLLIGTDSYSENARGRSDTTVLVQLDTESKTIKMISFLRDMYVKIPGRGSNRINASYAKGGASLLEKTLEQNFGVTVDAYVAVNFDRLVNVIDAIGGVEVDVSEAERVQVNSILRFYNTKIGAVSVTSC